MSRCFPYPPPGYLRHGLVESIKLEREKVLPKTERKIHKRREKKEKKKKERKEKEKTHGISKKLKKLVDDLNGDKDEQLGNSDLTEEHEPPVCYLSDGTQNSNKRKRETPSSSECRVNGSIKIRFSFKKPRESDASLCEERVCSTSGRADCSTQPIAQEQPDPSNQKENIITHVPEQKITTVLEQKLWRDNERKQQIPSSGTSVFGNKMKKAALQYKTLLEDLMPLPLQLQNHDDYDDDWLFKSKQQGKHAGERSKVDDDVRCPTIATSCPRAHFLPDVEIYALPYTVPF
ncbi:PREDICTED: uncharacterized protein LOC18591588 [Theobroma cacao]|uniref:Uncharacterized protein LOC18591588 n=1 Tax=Theobroma cacao TaxID=3641 RepID=A0AB32UUT6_THECC|nr:PREDICTED: uncharacterized protein LOC18591588 [Theobroma cacao]